MKFPTRSAWFGVLALVATLGAAPVSVTAQISVTDDDAAPLTEPSVEAQDAAEAEEIDPIRPAVGTTLEEWRWTRRPVVVFAESPNDPRFIEQMENITDRLEALVDRDVIVITDTDPASGSSFRQSLRPRDFMVVVMAKDGTIVLRRPVPLSVREISRSIDKLPLRRQEMRERQLSDD